ncbi:hypothetical protein P3T76_003415 [Phytophthora citrophthora]|uniref:Uncharacterized protein n=1 Tax=Phytophthora citrophthora TaxID=4793 RepID=A0AAD9GU93_9STRA|nr:hypothetical protein P3T76_003415 [Phytophthora citrophthora]
MSRQGFRSISLFPRKRTESRSHPRICNSAPTHVLPTQDEDWDLESLHSANESILLPVLTTQGDAQTDHDAKCDCTETENQPNRSAGDFTDFLDSSSSDSDSIFLDESGSDEPYEFWTKRTTYNYSPFSSNSSFSFEDSDSEDPTSVSHDDNDTSDGDIPHQAPSLSSLAIHLQNNFRLSDIGPVVKRGWTSGPESFEGPTSI